MEKYKAAIPYLIHYLFAINVINNNGFTVYLDKRNKSLELDNNKQHRKFLVLVLSNWSWIS